MTPSLSFVYVDGREIRASSPLGVMEALRAGERGAPSDLGRFLDVLSTRAALRYHITIDVGEPLEAIDPRCRRALASLVKLGWLRVSKAPAVVWPPRERPRPTPLAAAAPAADAVPAVTSPA
ncbi:MAG: hypothetical protein DMF78_16535 [Acidobacteria bacterium]|nr:MAG: hypothetical protein DMF78_16535 [Acidobacteriota bacterium]